MESHICTKKNDRSTQNFVYDRHINLYAFDMQVNQDTKALNNFSGQKLKKMIVRSGYTKEQVVAHVQDKGLRFSLAGLDRILRNELPKKEPHEILAGISEKLKCSAEDFTEVLQQKLI